MTEKEFINALQELGQEIGDAAANAALAAALGVPYEDALRVEKRHAEALSKRLGHRKEAKAG